jgi:Tol biopolymer transport system component
VKKNRNKRLDIRISGDTESNLNKLMGYYELNKSDTIEMLINKKYENLKERIDMKKLEELKKEFGKLGYNVVTVDGKSNTKGIIRDDYYIITSKKTTPNNFDIRDYEGYNLEELQEALDLITKC